MALIYADRVRETSVTTGSGALTLAGPVTNFSSFNAAIGVGNTCYCTIVSPSSNQWEAGIYTLTGATTLTRTTVLSSSSGGAAVNFGAGVKDVFVGIPANRFAELVALNDTQTLTNKTLASPVVTTALTTSSTSFDLLNTTATTVNFAGAATTLTIAAATGTTTIRNNLVVSGNVTVNGTTTTVNATTVQVADKNIELAITGSPTNITADGGGITLKGATDKTINWLNATGAWTSSEDWTLVTGKSYRIGTALTLSEASMVATGATFDLLNTGVTTLNLGGAAITFNMGAPTGTTTVSGRFKATSALGSGYNYEFYDTSSSSRRISFDPFNSYIEMGHAGGFYTRMGFGSQTVSFVDSGTTGYTMGTIGPGVMTTNMLTSGTVWGATLSTASLQIRSVLYGITAATPAIDCTVYASDGSNANVSKIRMYNGDSGNVIMLTNGLGKVGIKNTNPTYDLDVTGNTRASVAVYSPLVSAVPPTSGAGNDLIVSASDAVSGAGGNLLLQAGVKISTGTDGKTIIRKRNGVTSATNLVEFQDASATVVAMIDGSYWFSGRFRTYTATNNGNETFGFGALNSANLNTIASNTVIGYNAAQAQTSGNYSVVLGHSAAYSPTSLSGAVAIGYQAGYVTVGSNSVLIGYQAANSSGNSCVHIGSQAALYLSGANNVSLGYQALLGVSGGTSTGYANVGLGYQAGQAVTSGYQNFFGGFQAGYSITTGNSNVAVGYQAAYSVTDRSGFVAIGPSAGYTAGGGSSSVVIGGSACYYGSQTGTVAIGLYALQYNTGANNVAVGQYSLRGALSTSTGQFNCAFGGNAGVNLTSGSQNTLIGYNAGGALTVENNNTLVGYIAGQLLTSASNVVIGYNAATAQTTNGSLTAIGYGAMASATGAELLAIGNYALRYGTGSYNVAVGSQAGYGVSGTTTAANSVFIGWNAGLAITTGGDSTFLGYRAGVAVTSGIGNTLLGSSVATGLTTGSYNIAIGYNLNLPSNTASSQLTIGNLIFGTGGFGTGTTLATGKVGIKNNAPTYDFDVTGDIRSTSIVYSNTFKSQTVASGAANDLVLGASPSISGNGGNVILTPSVKASSGTDGSVIVKPPVGGTAAYFKVQDSSANDWMWFDHATKNLYFYTNAGRTTQMYIGGYVGGNDRATIGTPSGTIEINPGGVQHIQMGSNQITIPNGIVLVTNASTTNGLTISSSSVTNANLTCGTQAHATTSGVVNNINLPNVTGFAPTSGTGVWNGLGIQSTINQTGGANGITRGIYINPTLTAAASWLAFESTAGQVLINTGVSSYKGLVLKGPQGQAANFLEVQNSVGTAINYTTPHGGKVIAPDNRSTKNLVLTPGSTFSLTVTFKSIASNVATLTFSGTHRLAVGDPIHVTGVDATFNGVYTVTGVTATTVSYAKTNADISNTAATGTIAPGPALSWAITNKQLTSNVAILTYTGVVNFRVGDSVTVAGVDGTFDGTYTVTRMDSQTFRYACTATDVGSTASSGGVVFTTTAANLIEFGSTPASASFSYVDSASRIITKTGFRGLVNNDMTTYYDGIFFDAVPPSGSSTSNNSSYFQFGVERSFSSSSFYSGVSKEYYGRLTLARASAGSYIDFASIVANNGNNIGGFIELDLMVSGAVTQRYVIPWAYDAMNNGPNGVLYVPIHATDRRRWPQTYEGTYPSASLGSYGATGGAETNEYELIGIYSGNVRYLRLRTKIADSSAATLDIGFRLRTCGVGLTPTINSFATGTDTTAYVTYGHTPLWTGNSKIGVNTNNPVATCHIYDKWGNNSTNYSFPTLLLQKSNSGFTNDYLQLQDASNVVLGRITSGPDLILGSSGAVLGSGTRDITVVGNGAAASTNYGAIGLGNPNTNSQYQLGAVDFYSGSVRTASIQGHSISGNTSGRLRFCTSADGGATMPTLLDISQTVAIFGSIGGSAASVPVEIYNTTTNSTLSCLTVGNMGSGATTGSRIAFRGISSNGTQIDFATITAVKTANDTVSTITGDLVFSTTYAAGSAIERLRLTGTGVLQAGTVTGTSAGNTLALAGGAASTSGAGGGVTITGGAAAGTGNGASITLTPTAFVGTGTDGSVIVKQGSGSAQGSTAFQIQTSGGGVALSATATGALVVGGTTSANGALTLKWGTGATSGSLFASNTSAITLQTNAGSGAKMILDDATGNITSTGQFILTPLAQLSTNQAAIYIHSVTNNNNVTAAGRYALAVGSSGSAPYTGIEGNGKIVCSSYNSSWQVTSLLVNGNGLSPSGYGTAHDVIFDFSVVGYTATANIVSRTNCTHFAIKPPTFTAASAFTIAEAVTQRIDGAPIPSTNVTMTESYALRISAGHDGGIPLALRANSATQTGDLLRLQKSDATNLLKVTAAGSIVNPPNTTNVSSNQNNLVLSGSKFQRINCTVASDITGIAPPANLSHVGGYEYVIVNVGTANLTIKHNSGSSTATNSIYNSTGADIVVAPHGRVSVIYDDADNGRTGAGWRCW